MKRTLYLFLIVAVLATALAAPATAQTTSPCASTYTVARGDWLSKIARKQLNDPAAYWSIVSATNTQAATDKAYAFIDNPDRIRVGQKLCIPAAPVAPAGLAAKDLGNATFKSATVPAGVVTLTRGAFSQPAADGSASRLTANLTDAIAFGQLSGTPSAAAVVTESGGGSGTFYYLHVVQVQEGKPVDVASIQLGDRIVLNSLAIVDNAIVVGMTTQGPNDPMAVPTQRVVNSYALNGDKLEQTSSKVVGSVSTAAAQAAAQAVTMKQLMGMVWKWERTQYNDGKTIEVSDPNRYLIEFLPAGVAAIKADCNQVRATYVLDGTNLTIQPGPSTMAMCPPDSQDQEFIKGLSEVGSVIFKDGKMYLSLKLDTGTMTFSGSSPTALAGTAWNVTGINNGKQAVVSVINGTTVTLDFGTDGMVSGSAGCNTYSGSYETQGDQIKVGPLRTTRKMCVEPAGIMEQEAQFLAALQAGTTFKISGNQLTTRNADGAMQVTASK